MALVRVITSKGTYDYVDEDLLWLYIEQDYVVGLAENIEEARERMQKRFGAWMEKHCPLTYKTFREKKEVR